MIPRSLISIAAAFSCIAGAQAAAPERFLSDDAWRADIAEVAAAIRRVHPHPFERADEADFDRAVEKLSRALPEMSDDEIMTGMISIVALLRDGHTRLSVWNEHPEFGIMQGHTGTAEPKSPTLKFNSLPLEFYLFDDGLYVVGADAANAPLIGSKIIAIGGASIADAIAAVTPTISADNDTGAKRLIPDRLRSPDILAALGVIDRTDRVSLRIASPGGAERTVELAPLPPGDVALVEAPAAGAARLRRTEADAPKFRTMHEGAMYVRLNEIENGEPDFLAGFMQGALKEAAAKGASRFIIDLRDNQGGSADWNPAILRTLSNSRYDRYGKLYVLIGRGTFSAAEMLAVSIGQTLEAIFVGEPTGSGPCHYGDSRKTVLANSGLTLRVSTRHWCLAFGDGTPPDLEAPVLSSDYFGGRDSALKTALDFRPEKSAAMQIEDFARKGKASPAIKRMRLVITSPRGDLDIADDLVARGKRLLAEDEPEAARLMLRIAAGFYPDNEAARAALSEAFPEKAKP